MSDGYHQLECNISQNATAGEPIYSAPAGIVALLSVFYGLLSVAAVGGNALVIWAVFGSRKMRKSNTNFFIANLALADITIGLFCIPFQFQAAILQRWDLPRFMCAFCPFVQVLSVNVSIFTLTAIAVDRHKAIIHPLSGAKRSSRRARLLLVAIWLVSAALAVPMAVGLQVVDLPICNTSSEDEGGGLQERTETAPTDYNNSGMLLFAEETVPFCTNVGLSDSAMMAYRHALAAVQYVCPLAVISVAYARMGLRLWGSTAPGTAERRRDAHMLRHKKQVIKMLVIVVAVFAICWLPLQMYNVLQAVIPQINLYKYINIIWFCCDWLAMSNSCCNPIIYGIYSDKFKREFSRRFHFSFDKKTSGGTIVLRDDSILAAKRRLRPQEFSLLRKDNSNSCISSTTT